MWKKTDEQTDIIDKGSVKSGVKQSWGKKKKNLLEKYKKRQFQNTVVKKQRIFTETNNHKILLWGIEKAYH